MLPEEKTLLTACKRGDLNAKRELYTLYAGKLFYACLQYAENREDAEDILQDSFMKIFQNLEQFRGEGSLEGWLRRITVNTAIKHYHKRNRSFLRINVNHLNDDAQSDNIDDNEAVPDFSNEELMAMISTLAPRYRMVFCLYAIEKYSHKEIAKELNISEGTSKSQLSRSRILLQNMIKEKTKEKKYARQ